jgi:hypothetical protein
MNPRFHCPHCQAMLNPGTKIVLRITIRDRRSLALLSPALGDYEVTLPPDVSMAPGEAAEFACPVCGADLRSPASPDFAEILRQREDGAFERVGFHRTYGEQVTFVVSGEQVSVYGPDAPGYRDLNFFGAGRIDG